MVYTYEVTLHRGNEDHAFIAGAPDSFGCVAHSDDQKAALRTAKDAMQCWIERARELVEPIPQPKGERLTPA